MDKTELTKNLSIHEFNELIAKNATSEELIKAKEGCAAIKSAWIELFNNCFPDKIISSLKDIAAAGIYGNGKYSHRIDICPVISVNDMCIAFDAKKRKIAFIQNDNAIGFYLGGKCFDAYPFSFLYSLPVITDNDFHFDLINSLEDAEKKIGKAAEYSKMFSDFKNAIPEIYSEIAAKISKINR